MGVGIRKLSLRMGLAVLDTKKDKKLVSISHDKFTSVCSELAFAHKVTA